MVPISHCLVCDGDVKAFLDGASNTVFEVDVWFNRILERRVRLAGVNSSFRNSPVFIQYAVDESHERRQAFLEVDALLDYLFRHVRRFCHFKPFAILHPIYCGCLPMWNVRQ